MPWQFIFQTNDIIMRHCNNDRNFFHYTATGALINESGL